METIKIKQKLTSFIQKAQEEIDTLRVKAALGRMDAADVLYEMSKDMNHNLQALTKELRNEGSNELEKFRLKLDILRIRYELGRLEARDVMQEKHDRFKQEFDQIVSSVKTDMGQKKEEIGVKLSSAYDALRRTWQS